jgi:hypothetical protein
VESAGWAVVGHRLPMVVPLVVKSQQLKYGERTARGIAAGKRVCCGLANWTRESRRSSKWIIAPRL